MERQENISYELVIDTDVYSGNFERPLASYVFGIYQETGVGDEFRRSLSEEEIESLKWAYDADGESAMEIFQDSEYGDYVYQKISPTPGWVNDGHGKHRKLEPGEKAKGFPAYQSVSFRFNRKLSDQEFAQVVERAGRFPKLYEEAASYNQAMTILGVRLIKHTEIIESETLKTVDFE